MRRAGEQSRGRISRRVLGARRTWVYLTWRHGLEEKKSFLHLEGVNPCRLMCQLQNSRHSTGLLLLPKSAFVADRKLDRYATVTSVTPLQTLNPCKFWRSGRDWEVLSARRQGGWKRFDHLPPESRPCCLPISLRCLPHGAAQVMSCGGTGSAPYYPCCPRPSISYSQLGSRRQQQRHIAGKRRSGAA